GVTVTMEVRRPELAAALERVGEVLKTPAFDATEFEQLKRDALARDAQQKDDPQTIGHRELRRMLAPFTDSKHAYHVPTVPELIPATNAVKLEELKGYHAKFYGPQHAHLAAVGDFDEAALTAQL